MKIWRGCGEEGGTEMVLTKLSTPLNSVDEFALLLGRDIDSATYQYEWADWTWEPWLENPASILTNEHT